MTFTEAQTTVMGMRFCFFYFTYFSMSSTSCESLRSLSCKTIISFAINLSQSCSIPSLLITFSRQLEIVTSQLNCTCSFFSPLLRYAQLCALWIHLDCALEYYTVGTNWWPSLKDSKIQHHIKHGTCTWDYNKGTVSHVIWVCNKWYMEQ